MGAIEKSKSYISENAINKTPIKRTNNTHTFTTNTTVYNIVNSTQINANISEYNHALSFLYTEQYIQIKFAIV